MSGMKGDAGGLVGHNNGSVRNGYNSGIVSGAEDVGGVAGNNYGGAVLNCYRLEGCAEGGEGIGLTDAQMKSRSSFEGFDFDKTWYTDPDANNGYPLLVGNPTPEAETK